ncbi:unnamed protein product [Knipowitschia caucasica]
MADVKNTLIERIKNMCTLDESTVADLAYLLVYVRYEYDGAAQEDIRFCQSLNYGRAQIPTTERVYPRERTGLEKVFYGVYRRRKGYDRS